MTRVLVNGVRLEVRALGEGPPVLLVHGLTGRGAIWSGLARTLRRRGHRTIVVDLLGHGRSDAPCDPARYAVERQAADLAALLERLGAGPADLIAYSMGARVALRLAVDHPAAIRRLVLESPSAGIADPAEREARRARDEATAALLEREGMDAFAAEWEAQPIFASQAALPFAARARLRADRLRNRPSGLAANLRGAGQGTAQALHDRLGAVASPTLVVAGALDPSGLTRAQVVAAGIRGTRLAVVAGAGHAPHLERPAIFNRLVGEFLDPPPTVPSSRHR